MKVNSYCVYNFRSIKESGWVECSNRTTLVGVNESGKTNMLLALWKFNPVREGKIDVLHDMPVTVLSDFRNQKDEIKFISVKFDIDESDLKSLSELTGKSIQNLKNITVSRYYDEHYEIEGLYE